MERQLAQLMAAEAWRDGKRFGIIPVRLPGAPEWRKLALPPFLRLYASVEFPSLSDDAALGRLIAAILRSPGARGFRWATTALHRNAPVLRGRQFDLHGSERLHRPHYRVFASCGGAAFSRSARRLRQRKVVADLRGRVVPSPPGHAPARDKDWLYVTMRPGANAWSNLRTAIAGHPRLQPKSGLASTAPGDLATRGGDCGLGTQHGAPRLVLIVDQFEELLIPDPKARAQPISSGARTTW